MRTLQLFLFFILLILLFAAPVKADVKLPGFFSSNMMLQRDVANPVWGWADPWEQITISIGQQEVKVRADEKGTWKIKLAPMTAGGPFEMIVQGKNTLRLKNILVGDIWICSGQSNMEWPVVISANGKQEVAKAFRPKIRLLTVPKRISVNPEVEMEAEWQVCSPATIADFSAVGYYFGRLLQDSLDIPIGLIDASWGGSMIEPWISADSLQKVEKASRKIQSNKEKDFPGKVAALKQRITEMSGPIPERDPGFEQQWNRSDHDFSDWQKMQIPQVWEKAGLEGLNGVVWFMKEFELSPEQAKSEGVMLELGPLDDSDFTFYNGPLVGKTKGEWAQPRIYSVPGYALRAGKNVVVVRIEDTGGDGGFRGNPEELKVKGPGWEVSLAGEWSYKISEFNGGLSPNDYPTGLFNGMINPLIPFGIKGTIWYQGESNVNDGYQYRKLMPMLIDDWRTRWGLGDFPFLMVQLANFGENPAEPASSKWAELREAQLLTGLNHPNTGMAVTIDIGEGKDIHPRNKQDVGKRLGLYALAMAYGKDLVYSGPFYQSHKVEGDQVRIFFDHQANGLQAKGGELKGFSIAGEDGTYKWATARIEGNSIVVRNPEIKNPKNVRYAWADNPEGANLYNSAGLPASPFRTDVQK